MINRDKTTIFFSKNIDAQTQEVIKVALNVPIVQHYEKCFLFVLVERGKLALQM